MAKFGRRLIAVFLLALGGWSVPGTATNHNEIQRRLISEGELAPLPEAKPLMIELAKVIESSALKAAINQSRTLQLMRESVRTALFHLNLKFEIVVDNYPYDPPFREPFPFRPTLEAMSEAAEFLDIVQLTTGFSTEIRSQLVNSPFYADLKVLFKEPVDQGIFRTLGKDEMIHKTVDSYLDLQGRLEKFGEGASMPEFEEAVREVQKELNSEEITRLKQKDPAFTLVVDRALAELKVVSKFQGGTSTKLYPAFSAAYPYRRTFQALVKAVAAGDLHDRNLYPEVTNWHEVEYSWQSKKNKKLLGLYHFNRYKYQLAGLLADNEVVMWPFVGFCDLEEIMLLRAVPWGVTAISVHTDRADRHYNSPKDELYHDANHARRMWGYDKRKRQRLKAFTREKQIAIYRQQDQFIKSLMAATAFVEELPRRELELRSRERILMFETSHETARTLDRESFVEDLLRKPATPQPFEVQLQAKVEKLEDLRTFDGNLKSGADQLTLDLSQPTIIRYFYDRAPGFLANVDNKLRWGFYDSAFSMANAIAIPGYRTPQFLAEAATRLFHRLQHPPPPMDELIRQINDRSGQPELWNYFSIKDVPLMRISGLDLLHTVAGEDIQVNWRQFTPHRDRWKPTNARLIDGSHVNSPETLQIYFLERGIPSYLQQYFKLDWDPTMERVAMFEDLRNLPNSLLAPNHQNENLMSGAKAIAAVDRIWHNRLTFRTLDAVERWLVAAAQFVHQGVLDRNTNGARNNPDYNKHWLLLPKINQKHDLDLIRIAFEARLAMEPNSLEPAQVMMIREGIMRLYNRIQRGDPVRTCHFILSRERDRLLQENPK